MTTHETNAPILLVPYVWIGDFVRCHSVVQLLKARWPERPVDILSSTLCAPLAAYMPGVRKAVVHDLPRRRLAYAEHARLAEKLKPEHYGTALVMSRKWKAALAPYLAGIPERVGFLGEMRFLLLNDIRPGEKRYPDHGGAVRGARPAARRQASATARAEARSFRGAAKILAGADRHRKRREARGRAGARLGVAVEALAACALRAARGTSERARLRSLDRWRARREAARGSNPRFGAGRARSHASRSRRRRARARRGGCRRQQRFRRAAHGFGLRHADLGAVRADRSRRLDAAQQIRESVARPPSRSIAGLAPSMSARSGITNVSWISRLRRSSPRSSGRSPIAAHRPRKFPAPRARC